MEVRILKDLRRDFLNFQAVDFKGFRNRMQHGFLLFEGFLQPNPRGDHQKSKNAAGGCRAVRHIYLGDIVPNC
jgi:hypothetical protein